MKRKLFPVLRFLALAVALAAAATAFLPLDTALAHGRPRPLAPAYHGPRYGARFPNLPPGHSRVPVGGVDFFFSAGSFYRRGPGGFVVVQAPVGGIVVNLPPRRRTVVVERATYYYYQGVYYRPCPGGYQVVDPPHEVLVVENEGVGVRPEVVAGDRVRVLSQQLNVRQGPGKNFAVQAVVTRDTRLEVLGGSPDWLYVKLPMGGYGWVAQEFVVLVSVPASG